jgi:hypothetical protein
MKIMLDDADMGEPEFLRLFHQAKRVTKYSAPDFCSGLTSGKNWTPNSIPISERSLDTHTRLPAVNLWPHHLSALFQGSDRLISGFLSRS